MCGIAGLWAPDLPAEDRNAIVSGMLERLRHRGPDGFALRHGEGVTLGIARLAIVAPTEPAHAYSSEDGRVLSVVNGEIYNHAELEIALAGRGHRLDRGSDSVVVPHLYEERGAGFTADMDGQFAIALWDGRLRRVVLARDRVGEKPMFYAWEGTGPGGAPAGRWFAFASEPGVLASLPWVSRDPAPAALARYLVHGFFAGSDSAFAAIRQLPPAHVLEVVDGLPRLRRYWRPWEGAPALPPPSNDEQLAATTREELGAAIESRIPRDVPFGVFLSGGVDSGLVAMLAAQHARRFPAFTMKIAARGYDESGLARRVAALAGAEYHEAVMDAAAGEEAIERFAGVMDQPLGDPSVLPTWALARLASKHVPVVITGEGGDELFAGYPTYLGHRWAGWSRAIPGPLAGAALALARRFRPKHHHVTIAHMLERFLDARAMEPLERHVAWFGTARGAEARALLAPDLRAALGPGVEHGYLDDFDARAREAAVPGWPRSPGTLVWQLFDFDTYLGGGLLTKVDRCAMAHGVESRAPFLRPRLIRYAFSLSERAKLRGTGGKVALRLAAKGLLPDAILERRKQGFSPPFSAWARGALRETIESHLSPERLLRAGVLDVGAARRVLHEHVNGHTDRGRLLWTLLSLQLWAERWVSGAAPATSLPARESMRWPAAEPAPLPRG